MTRLSISNARLRAGFWEAVLCLPEESLAAPGIEVVHKGLKLPGVMLKPDADMARHWTITVPVPAELISDGVQTFLVRETAGGETLARFAIAAGNALEEDLVAEVEFLRAELDLLKRAFRRHCVETAED